jgi:hypothetical protein
MDPTAPTTSLEALVAKDRSEARLVIPAQMPRALLTLELCVQTLRDAGVQITRTVDQSLRELVATGPPSEADASIVVARAVAPTAGADARVEWALGRAAPDAPAASTPAGAPAPAHPGHAPQPGPAGPASPAPTAAAPAGPGAERASLYEHSAFVVVESGQVLGHCIDATWGEDGCDVTGKVIAAKPGRPLALKLDETILHDSRGQLTAQCAGVLIRRGGLAKISRTLEVSQAVDFSTGNVDFPGDVVIHRGVRDCFVVKAGGHVEIRGIIEGAVIECGGDLNALGGMAGHERGHLRVAGTAHAKYLDNVSAQVRGDLIVEREIINSDLTVGGTTHCASGAIIGGGLTATGPVLAAVLGSIAGTPTHLLIGAMPFLEQRLAELQAFLAQLDKARADLAAEQERVTRQHYHPTAQDRERQTEFLFEAQGLDQKILRARQLQEDCQKHIGAHRVVQVDVVQHLFHGVTITIQGTRYQVTEDIRGPLRISWQAGVGPVYGHDPAALIPLIHIARASPAPSSSPTPAASGAAHARVDR